LAKALHFSVESLDANRKGRLSGEQFRKLMGDFLTPAVWSILIASLPFLCWAAVTSSRQQVPLFTGLQIFLGQLTHLGDLAESDGKFAVISRVGSLLACLGFALYMASRASIALYIDLLDRTVIVKEGRVIAREEQTMRDNGRDPIEKYFFDLKNERYPVNFAAYRALETGSVYLVYSLPRSRQLVAIEPKIG
jgi:hypothetical protein